MRIVAGSLRGRRLVAPRGRATRPTSDRVREALFSILGDLSDLRVLDLYAGSGALAFEALSRGAREATLVEAAPAACAAIRRNMASLDIASQCTLLPLRVERALSGLGAQEPHDLCFADPPYRELSGARGSGSIARIVSNFGVMRPGGRLVIEHAAADAPPEIAACQYEITRRYGDTALSFYLLAEAASV